MERELHLAALLRVHRLREEKLLRELRKRLAVGRLLRRDGAGGARRDQRGENENASGHGRAPEARTGHRRRVGTSTAAEPAQLLHWVRTGAHDPHSHRDPWTRASPETTPSSPLPSTPPRR